MMLSGYPKKAGKEADDASVLRLQMLDPNSGCLLVAAVHARIIANGRRNRQCSRHNEPTFDAQEFYRLMQ